MKRRFGIAVLIVLAALFLPHTAAAQAQAANGNIEGTVRDISGAALPGVMVTVTNMETGTSRTTTTNQDGGYRAPLLPLGRYKVAAELQGFKTFEQQGIYALGRPDGAHQRRADRRQRRRDDHGDRRVADRAAGQDRSRPDDR